MPIPPTSISEEKNLDQALDGTFPASDPVSATTHLTATPTESILAAAERSSQHPGTVTIYRVVGADQAEKPFAAGRLEAARWTSENTAAVYASLSAGDALLEFLAHCEGEPPRNAYLARAQIPRERITVMHAYPSTWCEQPYRREVQQVGDDWARSHRSLAAQVPSALCADACNIILNPGHVDAPLIQGIEVRPIRIDDRLRRIASH